DVEEAELAALEERVLVAEGLVRGLVAVAEVGVLADGGGGEVEREDVVAAGEDDAAAVGREARVGLGLAGGGEPAEGTRAEVVEPEVAVAGEDAAAEVGVVREAVGVPALEAGREAAALGGRDRDGVAAVALGLEEGVGGEAALRVPPEVDGVPGVGPVDVGRPRADPRLRRLHDLLDGERGPLLGDGGGGEQEDEERVASRHEGTGRWSAQDRIRRRIGEAGSLPPSSGPADAEAVRDVVALRVGVDEAAGERRLERGHERGYDGEQELLLELDEVVREAARLVHVPDDV